jgi:hypothetical protein
MAKSAALILITAALPWLTTGCATTPASGGGTAAIQEDPYSPSGRDLGRGGATSSGLSSLDPTGNAQDLSVEEAREDAAHGASPRN